MGQGDDVIAELTADHREVDEMFGIIEYSAPAADRQAAAERLTIGLVRHSVTEQEHLYPAVREHLPDGDLIADKEIADHARMERILKGIEGLDADATEFDRQIAVLRAEVTAHVWEEEENLFPRLRRACPQEALACLGAQVRRAKELAPTVPPPAAPGVAPAPLPLAPGVGLVDRARDLVSGGGR